MYILGNVLRLVWTFQLLQLCTITIGARQKYVTCGSVFKLYNSDLDVRLHSHDVKYGTGSGQQSVTGTKIQEDVNSHWYVKAEADKVCPRGEKIACNSIIRLEHLATGKNLHSHYVSSPLSANQEVSCYGEGGEGDDGDYWQVVCTGEYWVRGETIMLKHSKTEKYLAVSSQTFGRPINGQSEIIGISSSSGPVHWKTAEGVFLHAPDLSNFVHAHTEL